MTKILVIEDQPQMRKNLATILEMENSRSPVPLTVKLESNSPEPNSRTLLFVM